MTIRYAPNVTVEVIYNDMCVSYMHDIYFIAARLLIFLLFYKLYH